MCDAFIPLLKPEGRVVNVASVGGHLNGYSADAKKRIQDAAASTSDVISLVGEYEVRVHWRGLQDWPDPPDSRTQRRGRVGRLQEGRLLRQQGFPRRIDQGVGCGEFAAVHQLVCDRRQERIVCADVHSCCPGWVDTDMGLQMGKPPKSIGKTDESPSSFTGLKLTASQRTEVRSRYDSPLAISGNRQASSGRTTVFPVRRMERSAYGSSGDRTLDMQFRARLSQISSVPLKSKGFHEVRQAVEDLR